MSAMKDWRGALRKEEEGEEPLRACPSALLNQKERGDCKGHLRERRRGKGKEKGRPHLVGESSPFTRRGKKRRGRQCRGGERKGKRKKRKTGME